MEEFWRVEGIFIDKTVRTGVVEIGVVGGETGKLVVGRLRMRVGATVGIEGGEGYGEVVGGKSMREWGVFCYRSSGSDSRHYVHC